MPTRYLPLIFAFPSKLSRLIARILLFLLIFLPSFSSLLFAKEPLIITTRSGESNQDVRYNYDTGLLKLALDKTVPSDGPYRLVESGAMNFSRAKKLLFTNSLPNFFVKLSYDKAYSEQKLHYVPFPVDLGIVGYRVCFAHPLVVMNLKKVTTMEGLQRFTHGQGVGWTDTKILRHNGFTVHEVPSYESLFRMVAANRFDLFCRGTNELLGEFNAHADLTGLAYDRSMTINYPLPRFFYTHQANNVAVKRIHRGIEMAYKDGSLQTLWQEEYQESIDFADLKRRKIYRLENPYLEGIDFDFTQYFYSPGQ